VDDDGDDRGKLAEPADDLVLTGRLVTLRRTIEADVPELLRILQEPQVAEWWRRDEWERLDEADAVTFSVLWEDAVVGCIQYAEETDPDYRSAAVDIFVSAAAQGRGVGPDAMRALIAWLVDARGHHRLTVDPAAGNARAIHVYERLGFRPVGVLRRYERMAGGEWRDGLLMELLAEELVRR
jgi:aminoglycoside 6'-N-acetyltransferase